MGEDDRRRRERFEVRLCVDYGCGDHFLFAYIENISEMGIFIRSTTPESVGTELTLRFEDEELGAFELQGMVTWVNPVRLSAENLNPGMGIAFRGLTAELRERLVELVRTIAYLSPPTRD